MTQRDNLNDLIGLLFSTDRMIRENVRKADRVDPFSMLQMETLRLALDKPGVSMSAIADYFCITPPSATTLVSSLVKSRDLTRLRDLKDRRMVRLGITHKGRKTLHQAQTAAFTQLKKLFKILNFSERAHLIKILTKLGRNAGRVSHQQAL